MISSGAWSDSHPISPYKTLNGERCPHSATNAGLICEVGLGALQRVRLKNHSGPFWLLEMKNQPSSSNSFHMPPSCSALNHSHSQHRTNQSLSTQHHSVLLLGWISASFTKTSALLLWTVVNPASAMSLRLFCHRYGEASGCRFSHWTPFTM